MQIMEFEEKLSNLKAPIVFWTVWGTIGLTVGLGFSHGAVFANPEQKAWIYLTPIIPFCMAVFGYWSALYHAKATIRITIGEHETSVSEIFGSRIKKKTFRNEEVKKIHVIRVGVDKTEGPDSFPRYGIVAELEKPYLILADLAKDRITEIANHLASACKTTPTDHEDEHFEYEPKWKRA